MHFVHHRHVVESTLCGQLPFSSFGPAWPPWCMSDKGADDTVTGIRQEAGRNEDGTDQLAW